MMIDVLIIDKTNQIKSAASMVKANIQAFSDEVKALNAVEENSSAVVLLHYDVRKEQTAEYIKLILQAESQSKVVVVANELGEESILNCLLAGAQGYQQVGQLESYANRLVTVIDAGEAWITRRMTATLLDALRQQ
ncbi:MAG: hypothetical protein A6F70_08290 [Cycloclasticus sp. symbiont of Bathymodiolus heckerae]|nr:MAG: hypothetical protein A6F70_08290 [Cycloclasticus sp. symbiont of Bathymodiolus heckerae]